jgi:hypothetical protein
MFHYMSKHYTFLQNQNVGQRIISMCENLSRLAFLFKVGVNILTGTLYVV